MNSAMNFLWHNNWSLNRHYYLISDTFAMDIKFFMNILRQDNLLLTRSLTKIFVTDFVGNFQRQSFYWLAHSIADRLLKVFSDGFPMNTYVVEARISSSASRQQSISFHFIYLFINKVVKISFAFFRRDQIYKIKMLKMTFLKIS